MARVLVIEDNPDNLELMTYLLGAFGHTPLTAGDGEAGLDVARREQPDLIICDLQLPKIDGYAVVRQLKAHPALRRIPVIAVTAFAMVGDRDKALAAGFDGYIAKPIAPETFVQQAQAFLQTNQRSREPEVAATAEPAPAEPAAIRATILVVDNTPVNIDLTRSTLEPFGYQVIAAHSMSEALALARRAPPDLILSDLHMPGESGFDFLRAVKVDPQLRHLPVIIHSATYLSERDAQEALTLGAEQFIRRPVDPQALLKEIEACLNK
jgi:two-component system cell cycle response regulator